MIGFGIIKYATTVNAKLDFAALCHNVSQINMDLIFHVIYWVPFFHSLYRINLILVNNV